MLHPNGWLFSTCQLSTEANLLLELGIALPLALKENITYNIFKSPWNEVTVCPNQFLEYLISHYEKARLWPTLISVSLMKTSSTIINKNAFNLLFFPKNLEQSPFYYKINPISTLIILWLNAPFLCLTDLKSTKANLRVPLTHNRLVIFLRTRHNNLTSP